MKAVKTALVYGGNTILGRNVIKKLNAANWRTLNFDEGNNEDATENFLDEPEFQEHLAVYLEGEKLDSLICCSGFPEDEVDEVDEIDVRLEDSVYSAEFASEFLKKRGTLVIPTCIPPHPEFLIKEENYDQMGIVTNALLFFKLLAENGQQSEVSPMPEGSRVIGIVPQHLSEKQIDVISNKIVSWTDGFESIDNGRIVWMNKADETDESIKEF
jgi:hypothetical protein